MSLKGPRTSKGISGFTSQVSICEGPPVIQTRITALFLDARVPARRRNKSGKVNPASPAKPALSTLRREKTVRPSLSRAFRNENAFSCKCLRGAGGGMPLLWQLPCAKGMLFRFLSVNNNKQNHRFAFALVDDGVRHVSAITRRIATCQHF